MRETIWSKLRDLWAIRRRCIELRRDQVKRAFPMRREASTRAAGTGLSRPVATCLAACFLLACHLHIHGLWQHGWLPYHTAPLPLNGFWTALVLLDLIAAILLLTKPRTGLILSFLIMSADVAVNVFARFDLHLIQHAHAGALLFLQLAFLAAVSAASMYAIDRGKQVS